MRAFRTFRAILFIISLFLIPCGYLVSAQTIAVGDQNTDSYLLVLSDRESKVLAELPLKNDRFDIVFIHSFHLTPVSERFNAELGADGTPVMHLFELEYESPGVGMPSDAELGYRLIDGKFLLTMDRKFAVIPLMVSTVSGHGIVVDGRMFPFTDWVPKETMLFLTVKSL